MNRWGLAILIALSIAGTAAAKEYTVTKKAGDYGVVVVIDKNPPTTGDNTLSVALKDASGADVADAVVSVEYSMPAMPGMPAMKYSGNAERTGKEYRAKVNFSMSGSWNIVIRITRAGKTAQVKFTVDAR